MHRNHIVNDRQSVLSSFDYSEAKMLKQVIALELFVGLRPRVTANLLGNRKLLINLINSADPEQLTIFQQSILAWNSYLENSFNPKGLVLNSNTVEKFLKVSITYNKITMKSLLIKSAYFD